MHWQPLTVASLALSLGCAPALASGISLPAASFTQTVEAGTCAGFEGDCDPVNAISQTIATAGAQSVAYPGAANLDAAWSSIRPRLGPKLTSRAIGAAAGSGLGEAQATYYFQVIGPLALLSNGKDEGAEAVAVGMMISATPSKRKIQRSPQRSTKDSM